MADGREQFVFFFSPRLGADNVLLQVEPLRVGRNPQDVWNQNLENEQRGYCEQRAAQVGENERPDGDRSVEPDVNEAEKRGRAGKEQERGDTKNDPAEG